MHHIAMGTDIPTPVKSILVASESRSGSNYLCAMMAGTGVMGSPREYFSKHVPFDEALTARERYAHACKNSITANGVISVKLFPEHWEMVRQQLDLEECFPDRYWIWLRRRDLLAQAISRDIALQTRAWTSAADTEKTPHYSSKNILRRLRFIALCEAKWRLFFARNGILPIELWYEDMVLDPVNTVLKIAEFANVQLDQGTINPDVYTKPQRTSLNNEWRQKFLEEMSDINHMDEVCVNRKYSLNLKNLWLLSTGKLPAP